MTENPKLLTVSEVAKIVGITRRILLHYEECGLIRPDKRNGPTGNRYYTIDTVTQIRTIRLLQELGLSLDEIGKYFDGSLDLPSLILRLVLLEHIGKIVLFEYLITISGNGDHCTRIQDNSNFIKLFYLS